MPSGERDIALGERTANALNVRIGDTVTIRSAVLDKGVWNVVGLVVPPTLLTTINPGDGAYTTSYGHEALFVGMPVVSYLAMTYRTGAAVDIVETSAKR